MKICRLQINLYKKFLLYNQAVLLTSEGIKGTNLSSVYAMQCFNYISLALTFRLGGKESK